MISRGQNFKPFPLNVVGSSTFGRYPKISIEKTYNMFMSDNFMVPYSGYNIAINSNRLLNGKSGRGIHTSIKLQRLVSVIDSNVFLININFQQNRTQQFTSQAILIGTLLTNTGVVYIKENNKPQITISDGVAIYVYDPTLTPNFQIAPIDFIPGYITFHDTYILATAQNTNEWRLSGNNNSLSFPNDAQHVGEIQTKPDNIQAVVRFPSRGNMIFVMGETVTESWFDTGAQLFPYQRNNQFNIDYGCLNPATVAYSDEIVVWLAVNETSGPIIMYSNGGMPQKITDDGFDYVFSQLTAPEDAQGFIYRQDGHLFYHLNFYTDNLSLFYDFNTKKIYHASDQNLNYFIAGQLAFFNNQYYFVSKNSGNIYALDTIYTIYQDTDSNGNIINNEIPRFRSCKNIRLPSQEYFVINDIGFTIETGETDYQQQYVSDNYIVTQDGNKVITQGNSIFLVTQDGNFITTQNGNTIVMQQTDSTDFNYIISNQAEYLYSTPRVDLSMSYDGGASFGHDFPYVLNSIGQRRNRLNWWQCGMGNDCVTLFKFWGMGRFVVTDGIANLRQ